MKVGDKVIVREGGYMTPMKYGYGVIAKITPRTVTLERAVEGSRYMYKQRFSLADVRPFTSEAWDTIQRCLTEIGNHQAIVGDFRRQADFAFQGSR